MEHTIVNPVEWINALSQLGLLGAALIGGAAVWWISRRRNGNGNGVPMDVFKFREQAIDRIVDQQDRISGFLNKIASAQDRIDQRLDHIERIQERLEERFDRHLQERRS